MTTETDKTALALRAIAEFPITDHGNMDAMNMQAIADAALADAPQPSASAVVDHEQQSVSSNDLCASLAGDKTKLKEVGKTERGHTIFREPNGVGGHRYWSDEIGGGVMVWDTCLAAPETLRACLRIEYGAGVAPQPPDSASAGNEPAYWAVQEGGWHVGLWEDRSTAERILQEERKTRPGMDLIPLYTAPPAQPVAVSVKPLEFPPRCPRGQRVHSRPQALIRYTIAHHGGDAGSTVFQWASERGQWSEPHHTYEAAIGCAQADYEQRICSALVIEPAQPDAYSQGAKEMREKCIAVVASGHHLGADSPSAQWARDIERLIRALPLTGDKEG